MILIKTPEAYFNEAGILKKAGLHISKYGNNALIIGGKTALSVVSGELYKSLESYHVNFVVQEYFGFVTMKEIQEYVGYAEEAKADIIIGVGGGKAIDLSKAVGDSLKLNVVTIPTIASTCAAWSALSTIYNEDGSAKGAVTQEHSPVLILADTDIIANAPVKYLKAGIGDTIAKWYEYAPKFQGSPEDIALQLSVQTAKLILDVIDEYALVAIEEAENNTTKAIQEIIDAVICLSGMVGSVKSKKVASSFVHAHSIDHSLTKLHETSDSLHGERVAFGIIVQLILENKPDDEVKRLIAKIDKLGLPVRLEQLGITENLPEKINFIARNVNLKQDGLGRQYKEDMVKNIEKAIAKADVIGKEQTNTSCGPLK